jgi:hypothetical protein
MKKRNKPKNKNIFTRDNIIIIITILITATLGIKTHYELYQLKKWDMHNRNHL